MQNILGDIFSSFTIYMDKPFEVGDFIIVGDVMGTVEKIGLKTTRIKALQADRITRLFAIAVGAIFDALQGRFERSHANLVFRSTVRPEQSPDSAPGRCRSQAWRSRSIS